MFLLIVLCIIGSNVQTLAQKAGEIRLNAGRLEIFYNQIWGTVCDDSFDDVDAKVACRQLGYDTGFSLGADVDDGTGKTWLDDLACTGRENRLADCPNPGWGVENCGHSEDVGIECRNEGDIRLISRRLEIFHNGTWGTVCDDHFDDFDAQVACRQLGYNTGISLGPDVDDGTGKTWLDDLACTGRENRLADCPNPGWGVENCGHGEDVGIECLDSLDDGHIRLISGMIKIFYNGTWGTVCDDGFDDTNAQVACRQLGYNNGIFVGSTAKKEQIWLDNMDCRGDEKKLAYCTHAGWGVGNCFPGENVKIKCNNNSEGDIRLSSGKLEIMHNNEWGTVCSDNFDNTEAQVACKQLGYRNGSLLRNRIATGNLRIWLDKLRCNGFETELTDCFHTVWGKHNCSHGNVVGIRCFEGKGDVRINSSRLEIYYDDGIWGTVCEDYFDDKGATVACRQLGYNSGKFVGVNGNHIGRTVLDNVKCSGNEPTLDSCSHYAWGSSGNCGDDEDVNIECLNSNEGDLRIDSWKLEIFYENEWGSVCREDFDNTDATVACRQLGYRSGYVRGAFPYESGKIWLAQVNCTGVEKKLTSCLHAGWGKHDCEFNVKITCNDEVQASDCSCSTKWTSEYLVELVAGVAAGSILVTVMLVLVCQYVASRIKTPTKDNLYSPTLKTDKPTREYDGVVAFQSVTNEAIVQDEIYDIVE